MEAFAFNPTDAIILGIIIAVVALIVRGMLRGTVKTCNCESCSGACDCCRHASAERASRPTQQ